MTQKEFFEKLAAFVKLYNVDGSKMEDAKVADALAFCDYHSNDANVETEVPAPNDHAELMELLLCNAGGNAKYVHQKWESYVRGCCPCCFTPNADAIRDHYFTKAEIERHGLDWNTYPKHYEDWQQFEACRLHAAAEMLENIAFAMGLFKLNR